MYLTCLTLPCLALPVSPVSSGKRITWERLFTEKESPRGRRDAQRVVLYSCKMVVQCIIHGIAKSCHDTWRVTWCWSTIDQYHPAMIDCLFASLCVSYILEVETHCQSLQYECFCGVLQSFSLYYVKYAGRENIVVKISIKFCNVIQDYDWNCDVCCNI